MEENVKISEILKDQIENSEYPVVGAKYNNEYKNLDDFVNPDGKIELITINSKEGMKIYRRSLIYILGKAFGEIYPEALLTVNYQLSHSMFCEIDNMEVTDEIIEKVTNKMKEIVAKNLKIEKRIMNREEAIKFFEETGTIRGRLQVDDPENKEIIMYYCEDYYNYFYGLLASNTGCLNLFELQKYDDGFLIKYPSSKTPEEVDKKIENKKLAFCLNEYDDLHKILKVTPFDTPNASFLVLTDKVNLFASHFLSLN